MRKFIGFIGCASVVSLFIAAPRAIAQVTADSDVSKPLGFTVQELEKREAAALLANPEIQQADASEARGLNGFDFSRIPDGFKVAGGDKFVIYKSSPYLVKPDGKTYRIHFGDHGGVRYQEVAPGTIKKDSKNLTIYSISNPADPAKHPAEAIKFIQYQGRLNIEVPSQSGLYPGTGIVIEGDMNFANENYLAFGVRADFLKVDGNLKQSGRGGLVIQFFVSGPVILNGDIRLTLGNLSVETTGDIKTHGTIHAGFGYVWLTANGNGNIDIYKPISATHRVEIIGGHDINIWKPLNGDFELFIYSVDGAMRIPDLGTSKALRSVAVFSENPNGIVMNRVVTTGNQRYTSIYGGVVRFTRDLLSRNGSIRVVYSPSYRIDPGVKLRAPNGEVVFEKYPW